MPINFEASGIELDSPYFKRNKSIADEWAAYNLNNPSGLTGAVNGFYIHMKLTGVSNTGTFSVTGNHQLQNVSAPLPMKATYVDRTILVLESGLTQKEAWKIRLKTFQSSCSSLFQAVTPNYFQSQPSYHFFQTIQCRSLATKERLCGNVGTTWFAKTHLKEWHLNHRIKQTSFFGKRTCHFHINCRYDFTERLIVNTFIDYMALLEK